jgi:hypothetical protein
MHLTELKKIFYLCFQFILNNMFKNIQTNCQMKRCIRQGMEEVEFPCPLWGSRLLASICVEQPGSSLSSVFWGFIEAHYIRMVD